MNEIITKEKNNNKLKGILVLFIYFYLYIGPLIFISIKGLENKNIFTDIISILMLLSVIIYSTFAKICVSPILFNLVYNIFMLTIIFLLFRTQIIDKLNDYLKNIKYYFSNYIKYWFIALGLMILSNGIIQIITGAIAKNEEAVREFTKNSIFLTGILTCIIAPLLEELVFRFSLYNVLKKYKYLFVILSGFLFGSMHVLTNLSSWIDLLYIIPYGIPGCVFAYTLTKSDNIFVPISLHFVHNTFAFMLQLLTLK